MSMFLEADRCWPHVETCAFIGFPRNAEFRDTRGREVYSRMNLFLAIRTQEDASFFSTI